MGLIPYHELPGLEAVYLEDSWVLRIHGDRHRLRFWLDLVLLEVHPLYRPARPNEQHCYRRAVLIFEDVRSIEWDEVRFDPAKDATGEVDFGEIDAFVLEGSTYRLEGNWGVVRLASAAPRLEYLPGKGANDTP